MRIPMGRESMLVIMILLLLTNNLYLNFAYKLISYFINM